MRSPRGHPDPPADRLWRSSVRRGRPKTPTVCGKVPWAVQGSRRQCNHVHACNRKANTLLLAVMRASAGVASIGTFAEGKSDAQDDARNGDDAPYQPTAYVDRRGSAAAWCKPSLGALSIIQIAPAFHVQSGHHCTW